MASFWMCILSLCVQIMVCSNHMNVQDEVNQVVIHELIHVYDDCRASNLDWANCAHHACSEVSTIMPAYCIIIYFVGWVSQVIQSFSQFNMKQIRAGHLSGDCHYKRELLRGFMKIRGHEQVSSLSFLNTYLLIMTLVHWQKKILVPREFMRYANLSDMKTLLDNNTAWTYR